MVEAVAAAGDGVTAKVIARRVGIPLPSVYRAIGTLVDEGYLGRLHDVHTAVGAASYLAVLRDLDVVVAHIDDCARHPRPDRMRVGEPMAPHATAAGKAVLADLRPGSLAQLAARSGPVDDAELIRIRADGTAVEAHEYRPGTARIAAPVHDRDGAVRGALELTVPRADLTARRSELAQAVREAAASVDRS